MHGYLQAYYPTSALTPSWSETVVCSFWKGEQIDGSEAHSPDKSVEARKDDKESRGTLLSRGEGLVQQSTACLKGYSGKKEGLPAQIPGCCARSGDCAGSSVCIEQSPKSFAPPCRGSWPGGPEGVICRAEALGLWDDSEGVGVPLPLSPSPEGRGDSGIHAGLTLDGRAMCDQRP